ncbi:MAG: hypothetical protein LBB59_08700 [Campylobacteraceae bacterium]|jgi:ABC-type microcin C transport system duplicated ATPase subunit YejF|nr:hypothetical protein [Campylobacteraceae bacterium]
MELNYQGFVFYVRTNPLRVNSKAVLVIKSEKAVEYENIAEMFENPKTNYLKN